MKRWITLIFIIGLACTTSLVQAMPYNSFSSEQIESIYQRLPKKYGDVAIDSIWFFKIKTREVGGELQDIGVNIEGYEIESPEIHSFIERKTLELLLAESVGEAKLALTRSKCNLLYNGDDYVSGAPWNLKQGLALFRNFESVSFNRDASKFHFTLQKGGEQLEFIFPLNIQVVTDKNKMELELEFGDMLRQDYGIDIYQEPLPKCRKNKSGDIYVSSSNFLFTEAVNDATYYQYNNTQFTPIFSPKYEIESFVNMFHIANKHTSNVDLNISHSLYGNKTARYSVPLEKMIAYCLSHKLNVYVGVEGKHDDVIEGCILLEDKNMKFLHVLYVRGKISDLFKNYLFGYKERCTMAVDLYTYVPTDNLGNIFDDDRYQKRENKFEF